MTAFLNQRSEIKAPLHRPALGLERREIPGERTARRSLAWQRCRAASAAARIPAWGGMSRVTGPLLRCRDGSTHPLPEDLVPRRLGRPPRPPIPPHAALVPRADAPRL